MLLFPVLVQSCTWHVQRRVRSLLANIPSRGLVEGLVLLRAAPVASLRLFQSLGSRPAWSSIDLFLDDRILSLQSHAFDVMSFLPGSDLSFLAHFSVQRHAPRCLQLHPARSEPHSWRRSVSPQLLPDVEEPRFQHLRRVAGVSRSAPSGQPQELPLRVVFLLHHRESCHNAVVSLRGVPVDLLAIVHPRRHGDRHMLASVEVRRDLLKYTAELRGRLGFRRPCSVAPFLSLHSAPSQQSHGQTAPSSPHPPRPRSPRHATTDEIPGHTTQCPSRPAHPLSAPPLREPWRILRVRVQRYPRHSHGCFRLLSHVGRLSLICFQLCHCSGLLVCLHAPLAIQALAQRIGHRAVFGQPVRCILLLLSNLFRLGRLGLRRFALMALASVRSDSEDTI